MTTDHPHYEVHLERDIEGLRHRIDRMSKMVVRQIEDAVTAFTDGNRGLAYAVILKDHRIDVMEEHIDRLAQEFLIRHMPVGQHLRFVVATTKVNSELERIGDYAEGIARRAVALSARSDVSFREQITEMSEIAIQMLSHAVESFLKADADMAMRARETDRRVDRMNSALFEALARPDQGPSDLLGRFALLGLVTRLERVADRACNIAEEAFYMARGQVLRHLPREDMRVLFLCDYNACGSQMAEGIARKVAPQHFLFSSAGTSPRPLDPRAVAFMAREGIDISRQRSKGLDAVGRLEDFNVVITLTENAENACPAIPYHVVHLNWILPDPARAAGTDDEVEAVYRGVYDELRGRIVELTEGLVGALEKEDEE
jgi:phosphate transport system regulatory protein PhoU